MLMPQREDRDIWKYFASLAFPPESVVRQTLGALEAHGGAMSTAGLEAHVELSRTRLETMLKVLDVDGAVQRVRGGWVSTGQPWSYDEERYRRVAEARSREQDAMLDYLATDRCRMEYLRDQLDDPEAARCGRCDNCGGLELPGAVSEASVDSARTQLSRPGVAIQPRKMWPTALDSMGLDLKGKIKTAASEGRAVARLTDLGHGQALRELFREPATDGPVPVPLARAVVEVLGDWKPSVDGIVHVGSLRRPTLTRDLAEGLSRYLQVPLLGEYAVVDPSVAARRRGGQLRPAGQRRPPALPARGGRRSDARRPPGAARRRPRRHRLDPDHGGPGPARRRRGRGAPADPRRRGGARFLRGERTWVTVEASTSTRLGSTHPRRVHEPDPRTSSRHRGVHPERRTGQARSSRRGGGGLQGMAANGVPPCQLSPATFRQTISTGEIALGAALLAPFVPSTVAGAGLAAFGGGLVQMYLNTPGMTQEGSRVRPSQDGTAIAKDIWLRSAPRLGLPLRPSVSDPRVRVRLLGGGRRERPSTASVS